jgi:fatty-acyl-CoA synthase
LIYTSGTTGLPKAARISHSKALLGGIASWKSQKLTPNDRTYCCLPLYHSAGGMMAVGAALLSGGSLVIVRRFSAKRFWSDCTQHDVTAFQYIGELCRYLLNSPPHPDERRHQIRCAIGNGLRPEVWEPFQERFQIPRIVEFYGATEGNFALINFSGKVGAIGQFPGFLRKLVGIELVRFDIESDELVYGADGFCERCDFDEAGELLIKITETTRFEGYTNDSATEKKVLRNAFEEGDAYFRSGDLLRLDAEGFFFFVDRIGDTFRWKGENVATSEVAEVISAAAGIDEANVYGVEIPGTDGRAGMAALVANADFDIDSLSRLVEEGLASYARPIFIRLLQQMEITGTFKHRKVDLVREGFDPAKLSDRLFFRDPEKGRYVPLDPGAFERIESGQIRL